MTKKLLKSFFHKYMESKCHLCGIKQKYHKELCVDRSKKYKDWEYARADEMGFDIYLWGPDGPPRFRIG